MPTPRLMQLPALLLTIGLGSASLGSDGAGEQSTARDERALRGERIARFMEKIRAEGLGPGSVAMVTIDGETVFQHATGSTALDGATPMTADAIFNIHSMTKPITSVAVMQCVDDGLVELDDPVSTFLPAFSEMMVIEWPEASERSEANATLRPASRPITIRDLLTHTSGIGYGGKAYGHLAGSIDKAIANAETLEAFINQVAELPLLHDPGERFSYGAGPAIAGRVVEVVRGEDLREAVESRILEPLGMSDTGWDRPDSARVVHRAFRVPEDQRDAFDGRTSADATTGGDELAPDWVDTWESARDRGVTYGDGGMFSTARDYTRFLQMMIEEGSLNGQEILKPATARLMLEHHLPDGVYRDDAGGLGFGLGFGVVLKPGAVTELAVPGQFGWGGAASTYAFGDTDSRATAVFMNALMPSGGQLQRQFRVLALQSIIPEEDAAEPGEPVVQTQAGQVEGTWEGEDGLAVFKGIPYAAPPVGSLRWKPPAPVEPWEGVRPAKAFAAACPQQEGMQQMAAGMLRSVGEDPSNTPNFSNTSEDCLYLNVWTRNLGNPELAPVIVWIHGGGYRQGAGFFECSRACDAGFVGVNFNMRLGVLGFFSHPSLSADSPTGTSGNQGLQDIAAVLRWVRDNISAFGGDPDRVILGGLSAGGGAAGLMLAMPEADGLYHAVFSVSPAPIPISHGLKPGYQGQSTGHDIGRMLALGVGQNPEATVEELQAVPLDRLMGGALALEALLIGRDFAFTPRIDGHVLPEPFLDRVAAGRTPDVPLIIGGATQDDSFVSNAIVDRLSGGDFEGYVRRQLGPEADAAIEAYGRPGPDQVNRTMRTFLRDLVFIANARLVAEAWSASGRPAWLYYNHARFPEGHPGHSIGSFHGYGFGNGSLNAIPWDPRGVFEPLDTRMFKRLMAIVNTRTPNTEDLLHWPPYDVETDAYLETNIESDQVKTGLMPERLDPIQRAYRLQVEDNE